MESITSITVTEFKSFMNHISKTFEIPIERLVTEWVSHTPAVVAVTTSITCTAIKKDKTVCGKKAVDGDRCGIHKSKKKAISCVESTDTKSATSCTAIKKDKTVCSKKAVDGDRCTQHKKRTKKSKSVSSPPKKTEKTPLNIYFENAILTIAKTASYDTTAMPLEYVDSVPPELDDTAQVLLTLRTLTESVFDVCAGYIGVYTLLKFFTSSIEKERYIEILGSVARFFAEDLTDILSDPEFQDYLGNSFDIGGAVAAISCRAKTESVVEAKYILETHNWVDIRRLIQFDQQGTDRRIFKNCIAPYISSTGLKKYHGVNISELTK